MEYEVYIDSIFCLNFALNFLVVSLTDDSKTTRKGLSKRIIGSILGAFIYCLFFLFPIPHIWVRIGLGSLFSSLLMVYLTFGVTSKEGWKRCMERILLYSLVLGGAVFCVNRFVPFFGGIFGTIAIAVVSYEIVKRVGEKWRNQRFLLGNAVISNGSLKINTRVLFDTGNGLIEPISKKPVCIISGLKAAEIWEDLEARAFRVVPFHSVGCQSGILKGYLVDEIAVEYEGRKICVKDVYLAVKEGYLGRNQDYDLILNPQILLR